MSKDVKFGIQSGSDWAQMGQILDFLRSVSVHFGAPRQNLLKLILKSHRFVKFGGILDLPVREDHTLSLRKQSRDIVH